MAGITALLIYALVATFVLAVACLFFVHSRRRKDSEPAWTEAQSNFGSRGMQYYAAGRYLALSHQFPVCANLLHHAVEMFLKAALCRSHSRSQLRNMKHNLRKAWFAFKVEYPDPRLNKLDSAVSALNKFERIRYPDEEIEKGSTQLFSLERAHCTDAQDWSARPSPRFSLVLEDVDDLARCIFEIGRMNPHFYLNRMPQAVSSILADRNAHPFPPAT